jgi:hypothetical protein
MIPKKRNKPNAASNSQIYVLEKEVTNSGSVFVVQIGNINLLHKNTTLIS